MLLQEFDPSPVAVINPSDTHGTLWNCPKAAVSCFERSTFDRMLERLGGGDWEEYGLSQSVNITGKDKAALPALELAARMG